MKQIGEYYAIRIFFKGGRKFKITEKETPRNWYNYLWNDNYITFVSRVGLGSGFNCAENAFVGPYGAVAYPKAVRRIGCTNMPCLGEKLAVTHS